MLVLGGTGEVARGQTTRVLKGSTEGIWVFILREMRRHYKVLSREAG